MHIGKSIRMERIFNRNTGKSIVVPMDHGVSCGPIAGLQNLSKAVNEAAEGGANAVLGHKGLVRSGHRQGGRDIGLILHLSSSTDFSPSFNRKTLTATVEDAVKHGADAVSLHINLGDPNEAEMLSDFGKVSTEAENWGMPLLAMVYGRGPKIANGLAPEVVAHCARVGVELGADVVKVPYTGDVESFSRVVEGCCVPILLAGGPKTNSTHEFLTMVHEAMQAGAAGLSVGRNVFQHENPRLLLCVLSKIVHDKLNIEQALAATEGDLA